MYQYILGSSFPQVVTSSEGGGEIIKLKGSVNVCAIMVKALLLLLWLLGFLSTFVI